MWHRGIRVPVSRICGYELCQKYPEKDDLSMHAGMPEREVIRTVYEVGHEMKKRCQCYWRRTDMTPEAMAAKTMCCWKSADGPGKAEKKHFSIAGEYYETVWS